MIPVGIIDLFCSDHSGHQPVGVERGGHRQGPLALPLQHRSLPGWEAHHLGPGTHENSTFTFCEKGLRIFLFFCLKK